MFMHEVIHHAVRVAALAGILAAGSAFGQTYGWGQVATEQAIAAWNIDVDAQGRGLPAGQGSVAEGAKLYLEKCAACHGLQGEGKPADALVGGTGSLKTARPGKTIGSYWPYATTLFDFIRRAMPYTAPQSLQPSEVYALTAWLLHRNGVLPADAVLDAPRLAALKMPNQEGFVADTRPDTHNTACQVCR